MLSKYKAVPRAAFIVLSVLVGASISIANTTRLEEEHDNEISSAATGKAKLKKCRKAYEGATTQVQEAVSLFSLKNAELRKWLQRGKSGRGYAMQVRSIETKLANYAKVLKQYLQTHDAASCLPLNTTELSDTCLLLHTWKDLTFRDSSTESGWLRLRIPALNDIVLESPFSGVDSGLSSTWNANRGRATVAMFPWRTAHDDPVRVHREMKGVKVEEFEGRGIVRRETKSDTLSFNYTDIGFVHNNSCSAETSDPRKAYQALAQHVESGTLDYGKGVAAEIAIAGLEGLQEGSINIQNAIAEIPESLKATYNLITNKEVPYCESSKSGATPPAECPGAIRCSDASMGHWCIGSFSLLKNVLGAKFDEISNQCSQQTFGVANLTQVDRGSVGPIKIAAYQACIDLKIATAIGKNVADGINKCFENPNETSKCFARLGVAAALSATGAGLAATASRGVAAAATGLQALVGAGKVSAHTAKLLTKVADLSAKGINVTYDTLFNELPVNPADRISALGELDALIKTATDPDQKALLEKAKGALTQANRADVPAQKVLENAALALPERIAKAEELLGRTLNVNEREAIEKAHNVGADRVGSSVYEYTDAEIKAKDDLLKAAGLSPRERQVLMRSGIVGNPPNFIAQLNGIRGQAEILYSQLDGHPNADALLDRMAALDNRISDVQNKMNQLSGKINSNMMDNLASSINGIESDLRQLTEAVRDRKAPARAPAQAAAKAVVSKTDLVVKNEMLQEPNAGLIHAKAESSHFANSDPSALATIAAKKDVHSVAPFTATEAVSALPTHLIRGSSSVTTTIAVNGKDYVVTLVYVTESGFRHADRRVVNIIPVAGEGVTRVGKKINGVQRFSSSANCFLDKLVELTRKGMRIPDSCWL